METKAPAVDTESASPIRTIRKQGEIESLELLSGSLKIVDQPGGLTRMWIKGREVFEVTQIVLSRNWEDRSPWKVDITLLVPTSPE